MSKHSFDSILEKYLAGKCTPAERLLVEQWYDLIGDEAKIPDTNEEWESLKTRMWIEIQKQNKKEATVIPIYKRLSFRIGVAASVVFVLLFGIYQYSSKIFFNNGFGILESTNYEKIENTSDKNKIVHLEDGSSIRLFPNSKISFLKHFEAHKREVFLEGEAFFEIAKNPSKPFYVYANKLVTKVIGTSFLVKAHKSQAAVQVLVQSGKVSVFKKEEVSDNILRNIEGVVILANQQLNFDKKSETFLKTVIEKPTLLANKTFIDFNFEEVAASEVLKKIQSAYGISIIFEEEILKECPFTADLTDEPLYGKISLLCQAIEANYETIDGQIIISSRGCR
ncbi:MAG: FecR family protein [Spirosomaceae bacterium]|nr:FecR family protein [Spirosomataceae bacterium]